MSTRAVDATKRAGARMVGDLEALISDGEELLKAAAAVPDESFSAARSRFEEKVARARVALADASQQAVAGTKQAAAAADDFVHVNAWSAIGVAAVAGIAIGFLLSRR